LGNKLRVLFAISQLAAGGSQRQLLAILRRLDRQRFQPLLYLLYPGGEMAGELPADLPVEVFTQRVKDRRGFLPGAAHRARVCDLADVLAQQRIDVLYDRTYHMTLVTAAACRRRPTPRISVIVTDPQRDLATNRERYRVIKRWLLRRAYRQATRVLAVSEGVRQAAISFYRLPEHQIQTLVNFFELEELDRLAAQPLPPEEQRRPPPWCELVAAGRLHPQKGFDLLIEAVARLVHRDQRPVHLRILGDGPAATTLRAQIAQLGLEKHVTLAGHRPNPLPYYRQADLFCLPSRYEGLPNVLAEAMLCRVPVLAADCPSGPRELLAEGKYGRLVPPEDPAALAAAIDEFWQQPGPWRQRVEPARDWIATTYGPDPVMDRLHAWLEQAAAPSPKPPIG
jgi:glycosyltransferase involved in cell wall biosynthesis